MKNADRINFYTDTPALQPQAAPLGTAANSHERGAEAAATTTAIAAGTSITSTTAANSAAATAEHTAVKTALRETAILRDQLATHQAAAPTADQRQLQRLLSHLDNSRQDQLEGTPEIGNRRSRRAAQRRGRWVKAALAAALLLVALQAATLWWLYRQTEIMLGRPLTADTLITATSDDLSVSFRADADAGTVAHLLQALHLRVVDGPHDDGTYVLRPESGTDSVKALNALRDRRDLVYSAAAAD